jgi:hypothetical protein
VARLWFSALLLAVSSFGHQSPGVDAKPRSPREYFDEMKNAGAFTTAATEPHGNKMSVADQGYVCFMENEPFAERNGQFLTFKAFAYDKDYAEAFAKGMNAATPKEERLDALLRMRAVQAGQPYVRFIPNEIISDLPTETADYFRKGGQELDLNCYTHGVKSWTTHLRRTGAADNWTSEDSKMKFAVESSTMRFLWSVKEDRETPQAFSGRCEQINPTNNDKCQSLVRPRLALEFQNS